MSEAWLPLFFAQAWQLTLVIGAVAALSRTCSRQRPQLAATLWLLVLIKAVTPPLWSSPVSLFSRALTGSLLPGQSSPDWHRFPQTLPELPDLERTATFSADPLRERVIVADLDRPSPQSPELAIVEVAHGAIADSVMVSSRASPEMSANARARQSLSTAFRWSWKAGLLVVWLVGVCVAGLITGVRVGWFQRQLQRGGVSACPELELVVDRLRQRLGLQRPVRLWITQSDCGPAVMGVFRPCRLLPFRGS